MGHKDLLSLLTQKGQLCVIWIFNVFAVQRLVASWKNKFMAYPRLSGEIQTLESNCKFETCKLKTGEHIFSQSLKTCSCPFVRYFRTLFWDDITIIWDENIVYFFNWETQNSVRKYRTKGHEQVFGTLRNNAILSKVI